MKTRVFGTAVAFALVSATAFAQDVKTDYDKAANFGQCWSPRGDQLAVFSYPKTVRLFGRAGTIE